MGNRRTQTEDIAVAGIDAVAAEIGGGGDGGYAQLSVRGGNGGDGIVIVMWEA
jgi:hypothetical protein